MSYEPQEPHHDPLVLAAKSGDQDALEAVFRKYNFLVRAKTRPYYLLGGDTEDVLQEGMIGLLKAVRDFDPNRGGNFVSFASLCITRQVITAVKTATRQKHLPLNGYRSLFQPSYEDGSRTLADLIASTCPGPEELFLKQEFTNTFWDIVAAKLSELELQVLALYIQGASFATIASKTNRGKKSVDNALWRIKRKLRQELQSFEPHLAEVTTGE